MTVTHALGETADGGSGVPVTRWSARVITC
jgi:hypothetical protein